MSLSEGFFSIEDVSKKNSSQEVLRSVNLLVQKGELWSILGPSGVGKTTLLRLIAGFDRPDSGRIILDGKDITADPPHQRAVNTVFQSYALFPHLTVWKNVFFGLNFDNLPQASKNKRVEEALERLSISMLTERYPHELFWWSTAACGDSKMSCEASEASAIG